MRAIDLCTVRRSLWLSLCLTFVTGLSTQPVRAQAEVDNGSNPDYHPPIGFGGYTWDTPLGQFQRLVPDPVYVRIAYSAGVTKEFDFDCFQAVGYKSLCSELEGDGFHALAEYFVDGQGFRISDPEHPGKAILFPITYQFCAKWNGLSPKLDGDALQRLKLCGARLHFRSETALQEQQIGDPDYLTSASRILDWLIANHGAPKGFERQGRVVVKFGDQSPEARRKARHENWYWCNPKVDEPTPRCSASVVYTFNPETGLGQVLYLTPQVWMYAHARRFGGSEDDPLYRVLHGNVQLAAAQRSGCTGTFLCEPLPPKAMSDAMLSRFRLPATTK